MTLEQAINETNIWHKPFPPIKDKGVPRKKGKRNKKTGVAYHTDQGKLYRVACLG
jgi:hypothetical protein